ncbi:unnamed protein product [Rotaria magnacalcarata]|uniref:Uncharacterized protein n=1 Tax=Rotaria magnacalcarata TaxID=392030 RepID=A0A816WTS0_9BILA|nr:unnamed protein product [Rotaria magnacalcarata]
MKQVEFSSNEQLTANREVNILSKESSSTTRINFDDSNDDDAESEISENENIDETEMKKSRVTTSPNKKKRSLIVKKNKSDGSVPKRRCPNNPNESTHVDVEDLDTSQLINYVKELHETNKYIVKQNKQIMLKQDRMEESFKLISKN